MKILSARVLRDFQGIEEADRDTRVAMMEFSYHLTVGNLDEAFRAVRAIKSDSVIALAILFNILHYELPDWNSVVNIHLRRFGKTWHACV